MAWWNACGLGWISGARVPEVTVKAIPIRTAECPRPLFVRIRSQSNRGTHVAAVTGLTVIEIATSDDVVRSSKKADALLDVKELQSTWRLWTRRSGG